MTAARHGSLGGGHPLLAEAQRLLDADLSLSALAERFGYSPYHFHRAFKKGVGETPKAHVTRLRLEKALLLVAVTDATFLDIALSAGFGNHETFTRAFKRQFGTTPRELRRRARAPGRRGPMPAEPPALSKVRYVTLPAKHLLAVRQVGSYDAPFPAPYTADDPYWTALSAWAAARGIGHRRLPYGFYLDMPGITPEAAMRADFCIEIDREVRGDDRFFHVPFAGGTFGTIEHRGGYDTLPQAYRALVDTILAAPARYRLNGAPPFQAMREVHAGGHPAANLTEVYFPVEPA